MAMAATSRVVDAEQLPPLLERRILFHPARETGFSSAAPPGIEPINSGFDQEMGAIASHVMSPKKGIKRSWEDANAGGSSHEDQSLDLAEELPLRIGAGLENLGNTCFMNSVLQCITYTAPLLGYLKHGQHKESCRISGFCAMCALEFHVKNVLQGSGRVVSPRYLAKNLQNISRAFQPWRQEDAHEYLRYLLEALQKACLRTKGQLKREEQERSLVHKIFGGRLKSQVKCTVCLHCSETVDPCLDLSLDINRADTVGKALACFTANELLDGDNKYHCEKCKKKVRAVKRFTIETAPSILTIHLKRFSGTGLYGEKINKKVRFDRKLDIKPFMSNARDGSVYDLYGVLVHEGGSTRSGHYFCFVRTGADIWHVLDDSRVRQVSEQTVLDQRAYILFYKRKPKPKVSQPAKPMVSVTPISKTLEISPAKPLQDQQSNKQTSQAVPVAEIPEVPEVVFPSTPTPKETNEAPEVKEESTTPAEPQTKPCSVEKETAEAPEVKESTASAETRAETTSPEGAPDCESNDDENDEVNTAERLKAEKQKKKSYMKVLKNMPKGRRMLMLAALEANETPSLVGEAQKGSIAVPEVSTKKKKNVEPAMESRGKTRPAEPSRSSPSRLADGEDVPVVSKQTVTSLLKDSSAVNGLFGSEVARWDDVDGKDIDSFLKTEHRTPSKKLDEWDEEYDRGKVKKVRRVAGGGRLTPCKNNGKGSNPFQVLSSHKKKFKH